MRDLGDDPLYQRLELTEDDITERKKLVDFTDEDAQQLVLCEAVIAEALEDIVGEFFAALGGNFEVQAIIGDLQTLDGLRCSLSEYVVELFTGTYGEAYVRKRMRIGEVHQRMGVTPKHFISAVRTLQSSVVHRLWAVADADADLTEKRTEALSKIMAFDTVVVLETYVECLTEQARAPAA